jgi:hypothetical protein
LVPAQSLSVLQIFGQLVAHTPSQQSCPAELLQSLEVVHAVGQSLACRHRPLTLAETSPGEIAGLGPFSRTETEQHLSPLLV